jgi:hypothetical protein
LANRLNTLVEQLDRPPLPVFVQVNTSGEETKFGVEPEDAIALARHVHESCRNLRFAGLMTIGMPDYSSRPENFQVSLAWMQNWCCSAVFDMHSIRLLTRTVHLLIWARGFKITHIFVFWRITSRQPFPSALVLALSLTVLMYCNLICQH